MIPNRQVWILFTVCLLVYTLTAYGGTRSTDSEIVFRTAESIARNGSFAVREGVLWEGFGVAEGTDGRLYSIFGPGQPLLMVPLIWAGDALNATRWYEHIPLPVQPSHQVGQGLFYYVGSVKPIDMKPHALRAVASIFNILVSAFIVLVFWFLLVTLGHKPRTATLTAVLLAFGSLLWPYSGTFFSEPLATLFMLFSLLLILMESGGEKSAFSREHRTALAGLVLALAATVHITAVLSLPFFILLTGSRDQCSRADLGRMWRRGTIFCLGFMVPMLFLGYYNYIRFGSILETGRFVDVAMAESLGYGRFAFSALGLYGLTLGGAKGLLITCPSTILGFLSWRQFTRRRGYLAHVLLAMIVFRVLFIASRSDWHGGYSLGPRYMVMIIPFILMAAATWLEGPTAGKVSGITVALAATTCIAVQLHFVLGEIFTFYYLIKWTYAPDGFVALKYQWPYLSWKASPITALPNDHRGPWLLQAIPLGNRALWMLGTAFILPGMIYLRRWGISPRATGNDQTG